MRVWFALGYLVFLVREVTAGSLRVAGNVMVRRTRPSIVQYRLRCRTDLEVAAFTSSITVTPGTLVVGLAGARDGESATIFVHSLFTTDRAGVVAGLTDMEDRLLRVTRGRAADR